LENGIYTTRIGKIPKNEETRKGLIGLMDLLIT